MYIVTGAAGFIGSHVVEGLNRRGITDIWAVDDFSQGPDVPNLASCQTVKRTDLRDFRSIVRRQDLPADITAILHQGACADTMATDRAYMMDNNLEYSKELLHTALEREIPFVYASSASVYGTNRAFAEIPANEAPINLYAESKLAFDEYLRPQLKDIQTTVVGLRYFNVYGAREARKGRMASMVFQVCKQLIERGVVRLFEGTDGFAHGEQRRDFISVQDVVDVNLFFAEASPCQAILNVGAGASRSFNDIAHTAIDLLGRGEIEYIPFPAELEGKYQSFTEADLTKLRAADYTAAFMPLADGIASCLPVWQALLA